jgi:hypothetical protein
VPTGEHTFFVVLQGGGLLEGGRLISVRTQPNAEWFHVWEVIKVDFFQSIHYTNPRGLELG